MFKAITVTGDAAPTGERAEASFLKGFDILADDGRCLYTLRVHDDGSLEVTTGLGVVRHAGKILDSSIYIRPRGCTTATICRDEYGGGK